MIIEEHFTELVQEVCNELDVVIIAMKCDEDHVHLFLHTLPALIR
ncbi:transposase (plasmid) [Bacillus cereus]|nr:transposase [Bacillus cereus]UIJ69588.1 transposase [Bacillus cereus]